ncbi:hypothetical protein [Streptomyces sp. NPDC101115]|uniref:hypothetical protein n=1 Tax=Streptomyces sp. NPDC101115 TaxID=3366106 RepID=UPI0037FF7D8C
MTEPSASPPDTPGGQSFTATSSDRGRSYQSGGNQTIKEHHHYAPRRSRKATVAWVLAGAMVLAPSAFAVAYP